MTELLASVQNTQPVHGFLGNPNWALPRIVLECFKEARPGMEGTKAAHEYEEEPEVFREKIILLAKMIIASPATIAYTGAGISTAAGVPDYASESAGKKSQVSQLLHSSRSQKEEEEEDDEPARKKKKKGSLFDKADKAQPTRAHLILERIYRCGWLHWWCQQNHDGLPQKAGIPQEIMNEIHGSWFDPSNRVINFSENLRHDLFEDLMHWERKGHLCLAIGTSLSGMNSDRLVVSIGSRAQTKFKKFSKKNPLTPELFESDLNKLAEIGGSVIIGYQCTQLDHLASLRIYSTIDKVFQALFRELEEVVRISNPTLLSLFTEPLTYQPLALFNLISTTTEYSKGSITESNVFHLNAYDGESGLLYSNQRRTRSSEKAALGNLVLDLRVGSRVKFLIGIDKDSTATVIGRDSFGNYLMDCEVLCRYRRSDGSSYRAMGVTTRTYGLWNLLSALEGKLSLVPFVNIH